MQTREREFFERVCDEAQYREFLQGESNRDRLREVRALLGRVIREELSDRQRQVIYLYYYEGRTQRQIAEEAGVNLSTVCRTLARGRRRIEAILRYWFVQSPEEAGKETREKL